MKLEIACQLIVTLDLEETIGRMQPTAPGFMIAREEHHDHWTQARVRLTDTELRHIGPSSVEQRSTSDVVVTASLHLNVHHGPIFEFYKEIEIYAFVGYVLLADLWVVDSDVQNRLLGAKHRREQ